MPSHHNVGLKMTPSSMSQWMPSESPCQLKSSQLSQQSSYQWPTPSDLTECVPDHEKLISVTQQVTPSTPHLPAGDWSPKPILQPSTQSSGLLKWPCLPEHKECSPPPTEASTSVLIHLLLKISAAPLASFSSQITLTF